MLIIVVTYVHVLNGLLKAIDNAAKTQQWLALKRLGLVLIILLSLSLSLLSR